jgi:hypothetical protein
MKKLEWPGIATSVGIVLILVIIIAASRDDFHLKDWQPLMAALIALGGGALAYRGAMAKVYEDRDRELRDLERRKTGVYLRLRHAVARIWSQATDVDDWIGAERSVIDPFILSVSSRVELDEAWNNLDLFPKVVGTYLDALRNNLPKAQAVLAALPKTISQENWMNLSEADNRILQEYIATCNNIAASASELLSAIDDEIGNPWE